RAGAAFRPLIYWRGSPTPTRWRGIVARHPWATWRCVRFICFSSPIHVTRCMTTDRFWQPIRDARAHNLLAPPLRLAFLPPRRFSLLQFLFRHREHVFRGRAKPLPWRRRSRRFIVWHVGSYAGVVASPGSLARSR